MAPPVSSTRAVEAAVVVLEDPEPGDLPGQPSPPRSPSSPDATPSRTSSPAPISPTTRRRPARRPGKRVGSRPSCRYRTMADRGRWKLRRFPRLRLRNRTTGPKAGRSSARCSCATASSPPSSSRPRSPRRRPRAAGSARSCSATTSRRLGDRPGPRRAVRLRVPRADAASTSSPPRRASCPRTSRDASPRCRSLWTRTEPSSSRSPTRPT